MKELSKCNTNKPKMKIHYFTPYSTENNIGKEYNEACAAVQNEEDWIVIRDGDTMFLTPNWGRTIKTVLEERGDEIMLFGATTNRIGDMHQRINVLFEEMDIRQHYKWAEYAERCFGNNVKKTIHDVAGFFMAFQKKTWTEVGGFDEGTPMFDRFFTRKVRKAGGQVALMEGVYLFHSYRIWSDDPLGATEHLFTQDFSKK